MTLRKFIPEFRPKQKGMGKVLGSLEAEVMEIVWTKETCCVKDVHEQLQSERKIAYTTVMTIMSRLSDKKLLKKHKEGNAFYYAPAVTKEEFSYTVVTEVMDSLIEDYPEAAFAHFVKKLGNEDEAKINALEKLFKERMQKEK